MVMTMLAFDMTDQDAYMIRYDNNGNAGGTQLVILMDTYQAIQTYRSHKFFSFFLAVFLAVFFAICKKYR